MYIYLPYITFLSFLSLFKILLLRNKAVPLRDLILVTLSRGEVQSTSTLNDWARYVDKINRQDWT